MSDEYANIPEITKLAIDEWVRYARPTGHFLTNVLRNDLSGAVGYADEANLAALGSITRYLYNRCPGACWGSPTKVTEWPTLLAKAGIDQFEHLP